MARILVVEDDAIVRQQMHRLLGAGGHDVRAAASAEEALADVAVVDPELVLLDIGLPGISGLACARRLREARYRGPIVFLTATDDVEVVREAVAAGAHAYLVKPVGAAQLLPMVESALGAARGARREHERMQHALDDSRDISAAVGVLAERHGWSPEQAFRELRERARRSERKITEVAAEVLASRRTPGASEESSR